MILGFTVFIMVCMIFSIFFRIQLQSNQNRIAEFQSSNQNNQTPHRNFNPYYFNSYNTSQTNYNDRSGMILHVKQSVNEPPSYEEAIRKL